jgi:hypothetical protein
MRPTLFAGFFAALAFLGISCGDDHGDAEVHECSPEGACSCSEGTERDTACVCTGGSSCSVDGDNIEFACEGNADCSLSCGDDCLITCPGTTTCTVDVGEGAVIECPGTASCDVTCHGDCTVHVAGAATATVDCVNEADGAVCTVD